MRRLILVSALALASVATALAQDDFGIWTSVGAEHKLTKKWSVGIEGEYRSMEKLKHNYRWAFGIDTDYKIAKHLKVAAGYKFIHNYKPATTTTELNVKYPDPDDLSIFDYDTKETKSTASYWGNRHRAFVALTGSVDLGRFSLSLREMWQYTYRCKATATRTITTSEFEDFLYNDEGDPVLDSNGNYIPTWYDDDAEVEVKEKTFSGKSKNSLRSRFQVEYNIAKCPVDPFASIELTHDLSGFSYEKVRYAVGADWKINKRNALSISYMYQNAADDNDDDDVNSHIISIGYKVKF